MIKLILKKLILLISIFSITSCNGQNNEVSSSQRDSLAVIASEFLWLDENEQPSLYVVEEPDIESLYQENKEWVKKYFPKILAEYKMSFESQVIIAMYLYQIGETKYLLDLEKKIATEQDRAVWQARLNSVK